MKRVATEVIGVCLLAVLASAALVHYRSRSAVVAEISLTANSVLPGADEVQLAISQHEPTPPTLDSRLVAERAEARVRRELVLSDSAVTRSAVAAVIRPAAAVAIDRLKSIRACEKNPSAHCPIQHAMAVADASGYGQLLVEQTVAELAFLNALAAETRREGKAPGFSIAALAGAYIKHPDDNVREQVLAMAALLSKYEAGAAVEIAARAVDSTVSGPLAAQALEVLANCRDANPRLVDKTLKQALKAGGWDVRDAVAEKILPFLTHENRNSYAEIMRQAPVRSKLALHLRLNLEEFDRMERL